MTARLSANQICEQALAMAGRFPSSMTGPDPVHMSRARLWLDMIVAHLCGTYGLPMFVPEVVPVPLAIDTPTYQLANTNLSSNTRQSLVTADNNPVRANNIGEDGFQFLVGAYIRGPTATGAQPSDTVLEIIDRYKYDEKPNKLASGTPREVWVDRNLQPLLTTWPVVQEDGWTIFLRVQMFAPTVGDDQDQRPQRRAQLNAAWNLWSVVALAARLGAGIVNTLPANELGPMQKEALRLENELLAFNADPQPGPRVSRSFNYAPAPGTFAGAYPGAYPYSRRYR